MNSNFAIAFLLLAKRQRRALQALYGYCRQIDDIVDEAKDPAAAQDALNAWKGILDRLHHLRPEDPPLAFAVQKMVQRFGVRVEDLFWILRGVEADLTRSRYERYEDLLEYCDAVASAVGLAMLPILGANRETCYGYALATGRALQLTNILRDLTTDAARGRVYLPQEDLRRFGYTDREIELGIYNDAFRELMGFETRRVLDLHREAERALPGQYRKQLHSAETMRKVYLELLRQIHVNEHRVYGTKIVIPAPMKLRVLLTQLSSQFFPQLFSPS